MKSTIKSQNVFRVTDIHSHILPGLDDGAGSWEQAEAMLKIAWEEGIRNMIATPHFMPGHANPPKEKVLEKISKLQEIGNAKGYDIRIYSGNEVYYHEEVPDRLEEGEILTLAGSNYVLTEFSPMDDCRYIRNGLTEIQAVGFIPILAHVERYQSLGGKSLDKLRELHGMGVLLQVNMASVEGKMGRKCQKYVFSLLENQLVDFLGTDAHSDGGRAPFVRGCMQVVCKKWSISYAEQIFNKNAENILGKE